MTQVDDLRHVYLFESEIIYGNNGQSLHAICSRGFRG